ncbi:MAG: o-succinylbenzoate synthase [Candidatus Aminicenantes bacterium]|nr:o-succinylbenzoate synthase [Candidatus Aminicenantes bacterium]
MTAIGIGDVGIYKYSIPFLVPLRIGTQTLTAREGLVIELTGVDGTRGYGEIAPLEGFSAETLEQAGQQILELAEKLPGVVFDVEFNKPGRRFPVIHELPGNLYASVCFGLETAVIHLLENSLNKSFPEIISQNPKKQIPVNALLHTDISQPGVGVGEEVVKLLANGFKTIKIKVGRGSLAGDMEIVNRASEALPLGVRLRLDANRLWNFETAMEFGKKVDKRFIEYIEEPFIIDGIGQIPVFYSQTGIGVALDESLNSIISSGLDMPVGVVAFILKPTLLGGFGKTGELVDLAMGYGIKPVISSCFEVGPGFMALLKMAAAIEGDSASGLDTLKHLEGSLFSQPVEIENGFIDIKKIATDEHGQTRTKAKKLKSTDY